MLIITSEFAQSAGLILKMDICCVTTQQIVCYPVDVASSVSIAGTQSILCWLSWADTSKLKHSEQGWHVCEYVYPASKLTIREHWSQRYLPVVVGGVGSEFSCLHCLGESAPGPVLLQVICGFFGVQFWLGRHPTVWISQSIAGCLSIVAHSVLCLRNSTPGIFSSRTSAWHFLIKYFVSSIGVHKNHSCSILAIFNNRRLSDFSTSAKRKSVRKQHAILPDTPGDLTSASKYF